MPGGVFTLEMQLVGGKFVEVDKSLSLFSSRTIASNFLVDPPQFLATKYDNDTHKLFHTRWKANQDKRPEEVDHFFLLIMSIIIFFMQCGFAFMEAGAVR